MSKDSIKLIASNKKAYHEYFIEDPLEVGIELVGTEVKSLRAGSCNLKESFVHEIKGELFICGMHISPYEKGNIFNKDPLRERKLLIHKKEMKKLLEKSAQKGYTIVATKAYFKGSLVKLEIALAKGKKLHDKRDVAAEREVKRKIERAVKISS